MYYAGIDIGGTKCAVVLGRQQNGGVELLSKEKFPTLTDDPGGMLAVLEQSLKRQIEEQGLLAAELGGIGISCGGPLDARAGVILSPPNLTAWEEVHIVDHFRAAFRVDTVLENDANACAVAEWKFGAGRGAANMIFLTFGTGLGAGLILNGKLYGGSTGMAGEVGHVRITQGGPVGYGKAGSLEGYCSGGGLAQLGRRMVEEEVKAGRCPLLLSTCGSAEKINAKEIALLAEKGDPLCREIYRLSGEKLGVGLSILVDLLNPDVIVIGSIFARSRDLLWDACNEVMQRECLPQSYAHCRVVPSMLGDGVGDVAALSVIMEAHRPEQEKESSGS